RRSPAGDRGARRGRSLQDDPVRLSRFGRDRSRGRGLRRARQSRNPALRYACDPVLGDRDRGLFVSPSIPPLVRDRLCPLADIITPNHFEFEWLAGAKAATLDQVIESARAFMTRGPSTIVVTSVELADTSGGEIETLAIEASQAFRVRTPKLPISPNGTGDLFASLYMSARIKGSG